MASDYSPEELEIIAEMRKLGAESVLTMWDRQLVCHTATAQLRSGATVTGQDTNRTAALNNLLTSVRVGNGAT